MSTPSFVLVPSVYKSGTLYTEVPFDGAGDMVVTRNSPATRVNEDGFIELLGRNLLFNSENFLTNWSANQITVQSSTTIFLGPFGNESVQCNPQPVAGAKSLTSMTPTLLSYNSGVVYTASVCVYAGIGQYVQITFPSGPFGALGYANYDIINNSVAFIGGGTDVNRSAKIEPISGTGWVRCIFTATSSGGNSNGIIIASVPNATSARLESYTPSSSDYFFLSSAQVEIGSTASKYEISTSATNNTPRLDYLQPDGSIGCPALLVEPSAQNLVPNSEAWNIGWGAVNATINLGIDTSATRDPYNTNVADTMFETAVNNTHIIFRDFSVTNGATYTFSFFVKSIASRNVQILGSVDFPTNTAQVDLSTLAITGVGASTCRVQDYGNGWRRISQTFTATGTNGRIIIYSLNGTVPNFLGSVTDGLYVFGAQLETGSIATSYIPTTTAPITRGDEVVNKTGITSLIGQSEGTVYLEMDIQRIGGAAWLIFALQANTNTDNIYVTLRTGGQIRLTLKKAGINFDAITTSANTVGIYKIAVAYKNGDYGLYMNGVSRGTSSDTSNFPNSLTQVFLSDVAAGYRSMNNRLRAFALYKTRLPNYLLEAETSQIQSYSALASSLSYTVV